MLSSITIFVVGVAAGIYLALKNAENKSGEVKRLEERNHELEKLSRLLKTTVDNNKREYSKLSKYCEQFIADYEGLKNEYRELREEKKPSADHSLIKEAARAAMLASHPDRSGKDTTKEFIKFKGLYDKFK